MNLDAQEAALGLLGLSPTNLTPTVATTIVRSPTSTIPTKRKQRDEAETAGEGIDCICGFEVDDGFSIACDLCSRWCHSACFDVAPEEIPDQFKCWTCKPRPASFKEKAVRMQKERLETGGVLIVEKRRKGSPGVERKHRRVSVDKKKRRPSMINEDEHVDIDEPWSQSYVHISQDIISDDETRSKLRRQAQHWRGVTAVADSSPLIKELPPTELSSYSNAHVLPPAYSLHTSTPITSNRLITDYKSSITPSSSYLSDPLNAYAHLGMPKPFVHLFGPPLDVALDSRLAGNHGRFARSGCRPNAVLRPLLCDDSDNLGFGVFALRDLKANEEVILGWEWDDGNAVHNLPALLKTPHIFPPRQIQHLRYQMSNILHALSSTFTTCACGTRAQDCAINRMAAFVDDMPTQNGQQEHIDLGPLVGQKRGFKTRERIPFSGGMAGMVMCSDTSTSNQSLPMSPSSPILNQRSSKGKERAVDGDGDIEMGDKTDKSTGRVCETKILKSAPHESLRTVPHSPNQLKSYSTFDLRPPDPGGPYQHLGHDRSQPDNEDIMPPKMRKKWMHRELESLRGLNGNTSPSSSQGSNCNHTVRFSESPSSSSNSGISLGSPTISAVKMTKGPGLGITYDNAYGHDRPQLENERQENHEKRHREDGVLTNVHHHHPASMPPPPMPAFLDPTTISSTKASVNTNQHLESPLTSLMPPSISPLTSFANLSLLSPALLRSTPPPLLLVRPPPNPRMTTTPPIVPLNDRNTTAWSPLRRHTAELSSTSSPPASQSSRRNDIDSITSSSSSSPPPQATNPAKANNMDSQLPESRSYTSSPPLSPFSFQPEMLLMDTTDEIQSTPHSPDPTWRADSPSGDHVNPSIGLDIPIYNLSHDSLSESQSEVLDRNLEEVRQGTSMNEDRPWESPVLGVNGRVSSSRSPSPASRVVQGDMTIASVDGCDGNEEGNPTTDTADYMDAGQSNQVSPPTRLESAPHNSAPSSEPLSTSLLPQPPTSPSAPRDNLTAEYPTVKEEDSRVEVPRKQQQASCPPVPKVKMSLRDFALRKKKQREEEEMTKIVQDTPSRREGEGGLNEKQVNEAGEVDKDPSDENMVVDRMVGVGVGLNGTEDSVGGLRTNRVKDEVLDGPGTCSTKLTVTNGYHHSSSPPLTSPTTLLGNRILSGTATPNHLTAVYQTKQELIEQPIPSTAAIQRTIVDTTRYAAMYDNSRSISPINPDPHHFQSYSPPQLCPEDGEIGEIIETPPRLPSLSLTSSLPAPPVMNRLVSMAKTVSSSSSLPSSSITPIPRGSITRRAHSVSSSSQARHSPPTHPRSFNAPYRQQPPSASTPSPPATRGTGVPPPTAPRALRQSMLSNRHTLTTPTAMTPSSYTTSSITTTTPTQALSTAITTGGRFPPYIPRGPSADRDRGCDIEQIQYARPLSRRDSREGGHTWGGR